MALFVARSAARIKGKVVWCLMRPDRFLPCAGAGGTPSGESRLTPTTRRTSLNPSASTSFSASTNFQTTMLMPPCGILCINNPPCPWRTCRVAFAFQGMVRNRTQVLRELLVSRGFQYCLDCLGEISEATKNVKLLFFKPSEKSEFRLIRLPCHSSNDDVTLYVRKPFLVNLWRLPESVHLGRLPFHYLQYRALGVADDLPIK